MGSDGITHGPLDPGTVHLCVDMQRIFAPGSLWSTPWMERVLPRVTALAERHAAQTLFTRFIPPERPEDRPGAWQRYYRRWREATREHLDPALLELVEPLARLAPPAETIDKPTYSAFAAGALPQRLAAREVHTLVVTGAETDVCVLATVLGAVDRGYRVIVVSDAICSSSDAGHDALMTMYRGRYALQIEVATTEEILSAWS
ncbi:cysteine hydrolase family protein [Prosthecomicrobium sp. N25]|uniref:cysteine hydrolase family protein n=1 Tax=Prosthecomicrobium sp. N25 TaxID=3129254 RepID=UPI00307762E9